MPLRLNQTPPAPKGLDEPQTLTSSVSSSVVEPKTVVPITNATAVVQSEKDCPVGSIVVKGPVGNTVGSKLCTLDGMLLAISGSEEVAEWLGSNDGALVLVSVWVSVGDEVRALDGMLLGASLRKETGLVVVGIVGVKVGDEVIALDGVLFGTSLGRGNAEKLGSPLGTLDNSWLGA